MQSRWTIRFRPATRTAGLALAILAAPLLAQCDREEDKAAEPATSAPKAPDIAPQTLPLAQPALDRAAILSVVDQAASAYASGEQGNGSDRLVGRPFALVSAFACQPLQDASTFASAQEGLPRAGWGPERRTIQLSLQPGDWLGSALMADQGQGGAWEAVEGFWLTRPWHRTGGCPAVARDPLAGAAEAPEAQSVGIAAVFGPESSRLGQRNRRAYVHTIRPSEENAALTPPSNGYRLRVEGRVASFPDGRAVRCHASSPDRRPVCVVAVTLDRVAFATSDGAVLSEWRPG